MTPTVFTFCVEPDKARVLYPRTLEHHAAAKSLSVRWANTGRLPEGAPALNFWTEIPFFADEITPSEADALCARAQSQIDYIWERERQAAATPSAP